VSLDLESQIPDLPHAILLRLRQGNRDGEEVGRLEAMSPTKVGMETVCPYSRTAVGTMGAGDWDVRARRGFGRSGGGSVVELYHVYAT
jgi:hypothetical protein